MVLFLRIKCGFFSSPILELEPTWFLCRLYVMFIMNSSIHSLLSRRQIISKINTWVHRSFTLRHGKSGCLFDAIFSSKIFCFICDLHVSVSDVPAFLRVLFLTIIISLHFLWAVSLCWPCVWYPQSGVAYLRILRLSCKVLDSMGRKHKILQ